MSKHTNTVLIQALQQALTMSTACIQPARNTKYFRSNKTPIPVTVNAILSRSDQSHTNNNPGQIGYPARSAKICHGLM